ncbi:UNVERIFIED_CONTAM: hypothetical protein PYX00_009839 [Menopon gallinae]|uniref:PID domain-containing protein n=1 Tax=Menopon gallinae TaxID=328185 RepID=A0AAW2HCK2_9NEOP
MRNSNLLKWTHNNNKQSNKGNNRNWIHSPDALQRGHIAYLVKFLGSTEVDQPKGIEVVKEGIRKLKFNQQLRKAEGTKTPKVELTISIDGVAIQEPKTKRIMNQYPLHRISYCADDKGEKKFFSFIAKEQDSDHHVCFVFVSDKLAEEITLTIGQAFDLAYRRFIETSGRDLETQRHVMLLQQKLKRLEVENNVLRQRLSDVSKIKGTADVEEYMAKNGIANLLTVQQSSNTNDKDKDNNSITNSTDSTPLSFSSANDFLNDTNSNSSRNSRTQYDQLVNFGTNASENGAAPPPVPPRAFESNKPFQNDFLRDNTTTQPSVGTKLEGLLLDDLEDDFNPRAYEAESQSKSTTSTSPSNAFNGISVSPPSLSPPPKQGPTARPRPQPSNGHPPWGPLQRRSLLKAESRVKRF